MKLRRATRELAALGDELMRKRDATGARTIRGSLRGQEVRVVCPEDFVILKILATRERDLEDARSVIDKQTGRLDMALIARELTSLTSEITDHDISGRLARLRP